MSSRQLSTARRRMSCFAALATFGAMVFTATPAVAANPDACGLATQHEMAVAFGLTNSVQHKSVLRAPGNPAGVAHIRCRAFAWKGKKPTNAARQRDGLLAGTVATYRIETWVADSGSSAETWLANFPKKLEGLKSRAKALFLEGSLQGRTFKPPTFGLESAIGYQAPVGGLRRLRAFWWDRSSGTLISFNIVEDRDKPVGVSLRKLASEIVPEIE
jgi:hypothetical protein